MDKQHPSFQEPRRRRRYRLSRREWILILVILLGLAEIIWTVRASINASDPSKPLTAPWVGPYVARMV